MSVFYPYVYEGNLVTKYPFVMEAINIIGSLKNNLWHWQLICMSFISDMAKFFCHCYEALVQYILFISLNKINSQLHVWVLWAYHHVIGRRTYLQYKIIAPCLHTSCFILNWFCLVLTTALKITRQKANDNIWHFDSLFACPL